MNVSETTIIEYILANPGHYSCTIDGATHQIAVDNARTLRVVDYYGFFDNVSTGHPVFVSVLSDIYTNHAVVFEESLIRKIKENILKEKIAYELKELLPAAKAMISHYVEVKRRDECNPAAYIRMYWLKNIDFEQSGKGTVLIVPNGRGLDDGGDYIKGYIYHDDHASIKYEGVQAWRYHAIMREDAEALNSDMSGLEDWLELLR